MTLRHRRETGDVPPIVAAHHMGCASLAEFEAKLAALVARGFPAPDPTTGNFDLDAIKTWRRARHPQLFPADRLPGSVPALDAGMIDVGERLAAMPARRR
jgi:hypothetical protein